MSHVWAGATPGESVRRQRRRLIWRPRAGKNVRIAVGPGAGAVGVVQWRRSRGGKAMVKIDRDSRKLAGEWIDVPEWRLAPPRRRWRNSTR